MFVYFLLLMLFQSSLIISSAPKDNFIPAKLLREYEHQTFLTLDKQRVVSVCYTTSTEGVVYNSGSKNMTNGEVTFFSRICQKDNEETTNRPMSPDVEGYLQDNINKFIASMEKN